MTQKDYRDYLQDILDSLNDIDDFVKEYSYEAFLKDKKTSNAVIRSLEVMGEAAKNIPESLRNKYPDVPWRQISGMRDKLIHEYFGVDLEIVWQAIKKDLPVVTPLIESMLDDLEKSG